MKKSYLSNQDEIITKKPEKNGLYDEKFKKIKLSLEKVEKFGKKLKKNYSHADLIKLYKESMDDNESEEVLEFIRLILENSENVLNIISYSKERTFRQSGELIDNKLAREPIERQITIFDFLEKIENREKEQENTTQPVISGLDLTPAEDRIVHTLSLLISKHSETRNQNSPNYYMGNHEKGITNINSIDLETARLMISPHELYSSYLGKTDYNSDHINFILQTLKELSAKNFLVTLTIEKNDKVKGKRYDKLRTYLPLFQIGILNKDLTESENQEIENNNSLIEGKWCKLLFKFNPVFTNSIREKYVEFPEDIHLRIARSSGKKGRVSQCTNLMRDFLFREKQKNRYLVIRDEETLFRILNLEKMRKEGRKKKVHEILQKSFDIFLDIGLLINVTKSVGKNGQNQFLMEINPNFK